MSEDMEDWKRLDKEHEKLEECRKEEEKTYSAFCRARRERERQEEEVSYRFRKMMDAAEERLR